MLARKGQINVDDVLAVCQFCAKFLLAQAQRFVADPARRVIGCDTDPAMLEHARANVPASHHETQIELYPWDARNLALPDTNVNAICADLPFGIAIGLHQQMWSYILRCFLKQRALPDPTLVWYC